MITKRKGLIDKLIQCRGNSMNTRYYLYYDEGTDIPKYVNSKHLKNFFKNENTACFSGLPNKLRNKEKEYNRLLYHIDNIPKIVKLPNKEQIIEWIKLCKEKQFIFKDVKYDLSRHMYLVPLHKDIDINHLYVCLTSLRMIREFPKFVENMLMLNKESEIDFYLAWLISSKISVGNGCHNIVPNDCYGIMFEIKNIHLPIQTAYSLKRFIKKIISSGKSKGLYSGNYWGINNKLKYSYTSLSNLNISINKLLKKETDIIMKSKPKDLNENKKKFMKAINYTPKVKNRIGDE